ncbi:MAG: hypothetical protein PHW52_01610 [Candidatus Pacebacteria bacterium]|nr:hypothetical protein [Candidatus Paceibacterota bacterium]
MILTEDEINEFSQNVSVERIMSLSKTRQFRKMAGKIKLITSENEGMPFVVLDMMYAAIGRIKGFPEGEGITYSGETLELWNYLSQRIDNIKEKPALFETLLMIGIAIQRLERNHPITE